MELPIKRMLLAFLFCPAFLSGQTTLRTDHEKRVDEKAQLLRKYFNSRQMDSMYALMSPSFKSKVTQQSLEQGIVTQLAPYGIITEYEFESSRNGVSKYRTKMLAGLVLQTLVGIDENGLVSTYAMQPYRDESAPKRTTLYSDNPMHSPLDSLVDRAIRSYMLDSVTAGISVAIHHNGKDHFYNYGEADKENNVKAGAETIYEIGSITKTFTGFLLAKAVSEKKLALTDPITKHLPDPVARNEALKGIQLVHLANHTSGLPRLPVDLYNSPGLNRDDPYAHYDETLLMKGLSQIKPTRPPGAKYEYSNYATGILGAILARAYKTSYPQLVEQQILRPMKLANTTAGNELMPGIAKGYDAKGNPASYWRFDVLAALGSIKSNAKDMLVYGKVMMSSFAEKGPVALLLTTPTWNEPPQVVTLGWHRTPDEDAVQVFQHGGGTYGFRSQLSVCPAKKWVVVTLANHGIDPGASGVAAAIANELMKP